MSAEHYNAPALKDKTFVGTPRPQVFFDITALVSRTVAKTLGVLVSTAPAPRAPLQYTDQLIQFTDAQHF